jgi:hypothetical protein
MPRRYLARHAGRGRVDRHVEQTKSVRFPAAERDALLVFYDRWAELNGISVNAAMVQALREFAQDHEQEAASVALFPAPVDEGEVFSAREAEHE